ncbi:MAG: SRPBCC domain-containing protein [Deltaproteobacteria bacterium]|nr:SRPBCC domain-containing protein [Deltaproteobacteria bacterium]
MERPNDWWIADLRCVAGESTVELDARAGGTLVESNPDGSSLLWFTVISVEPQRSLNLAGSLAPPFGGPCQTYLLIELEQEAGTTVVRMTNSMHGHVNEAMLSEMESGWRMLLDNGLKALVEADLRT